MREVRHWESGNRHWALGTRGRRTAGVLGRGGGLGGGCAFAHSTRGGMRCGTRRENWLRVRGPHGGPYEDGVCLSLLARTQHPRRDAVWHPARELVARSRSARRTLRRWRLLVVARSHTAPEAGCGVAPGERIGCAFAVRTADPTKMASACRCSLAHSTRGGMRCGTRREKWLRVRGPHGGPYGGACAFALSTSLR